MLRAVPFVYRYTYFPSPFLSRTQTHYTCYKLPLAWQYLTKFGAKRKLSKTRSNWVWVVGSINSWKILKGVDCQINLRTTYCQGIISKEKKYFFQLKFEFWWVKEWNKFSLIHGAFHSLLHFGKTYSPRIRR